MPAAVVSVMNMKGGVGKTTVSAHVMRVLYHALGKKVLLIDLDPQFNLTQCVITGANYASLKSTNKTIFSIMEPPSKVGLFDVATTSHAPPLVEDVNYRLRFFTDGTAYIDLVAGNFELVKYSLIDDKNKLSMVKERFLRFVSDCKAKYDLVH